MARPYKCICRGGWGPGPPQQIIFKIIQEIHLIEIDLQNSLKNDKFLSQAFDEVNNTSKIWTIQFKMFSDKECSKHTVSLK